MVDVMVDVIVDVMVDGNVQTYSGTMFIKKPLAAFCFGFVFVCIVFMTRDMNNVTLRAMSQSSTVSSFFLKSYVEQPESSNKDGAAATQVLVLTYMRSGSSLTGDILQHSPGAFYVYEPLRAIGHKNEESYAISYVNGTVRKPPFDMNEETIMAMRNWFTCDIDRLVTIGLTDSFMSRGIKTNMFKICYHTETKNSYSSALAMKRCSTQLKDMCNRSPVRIIKTIRLEIGTIKHLLDELPNLKLIHLVRDPRATLMSQSQLNQCSTYKGGLEGCTNKFCTRLENDAFEMEMLTEKYPERVMTAFYEDIARHPIETSRQMYEFIGTTFTESAEQYVYNITSAGNANNCDICTTRSNSSEHINTWKTTMKIGFLNIVQSRCNYVLKRFKYEIFQK